MIEIDIPGFRKLQLVHLVSDYNGTLALDGALLPGVADALKLVATQLRVHVITADTFGLARSQLEGLPVELVITPVSNQETSKLQYVQKLGPSSVVAMGNGRNDRKVLYAAAIGIALLQREGAATQTLASADLVSTNVIEALDLLRNPKRLTATLRS